MSASDIELVIRSDKGVKASAMNDFWSGLRVHNVWMTLSFNEVAQRFGRTYLGVAWLLISFVAMMSVKVVFFGSLQNADIYEYFVFLSIGLAVWQYVSQCLNSGCTSYIRSESWIKAMSYPHSVYLMKTSVSAIIENSVILIPVALIVVGVWESAQNIYSLLVFPALLVLFVNSIVASAFLAPLATAFRDVIHIVSTVVRVMFFATPIIWIPDAVDVPQFLIDLNPFAHVIAIIRDPLLYGTPGWDHWIAMGIITTINVILGLLMYVVTRYRQVHWI